MTITSPEDRGKLHIVMLDPFFRRDDTPGSTRTHDLARRLAQSGHTVSILTTSAALAGEISDDVLHYAIVPVDAPLRFGFPPSPHVTQAFARGVLWRLWRMNNVDAIYAVDGPLRVMPLLSAFCLARGVPLIFEVRNGLPALAPKTAPFGERVAARLARGLFRMAAAFARRVVVLSPEQQDALNAEKIGGEKIVLTAPGCDSARFAAAPGSGTSALTAYPQLAQATLAIYAGGMSAERGLDYVLEVAAATYAVAPHITFVFCGDGPSRENLEARAQALGVLSKNVWFIDPLPRKDLPALLNAAAAVIVGDNDGATGGALAFDALAAARPVILATRGWQWEMIESRGAGMGLPENDVAAAVREIMDFLTDSDGLRRAGQQAAALAAGRFNIDRVSGDVRAAIEDAVAADPRHAVMRRRTLRAKRAIDIVVSLAGLVVLSPVFLVLAAIAAIKIGRPIFFTQARTGLKGKVFKIVKFRSMTNARDGAGNLLPDAERLTPFGKFLRRSSLDELPELLNVLKGDMSLVGPRPLLPEYLPYYAPEQRRRHDVVPGLTGWSQINGRNALTWEDKFAHDVWYVDNLGLWLDVKILFKTLWTLVTGRGISADGHATMPRFDEVMARRQGAEDV